MFLKKYNLYFDREKKLIYIEKENYNKNYSFNYILDNFFFNYIYFDFSILYIFLFEKISKKIKSK